MIPDISKLSSEYTVSALSDCLSDQLNLDLTSDARLEGGQGNPLSREIGFELILRNAVRLQHVGVLGARALLDLVPANADASLRRLLAV